MPIAQWRAQLQCCVCSGRGIPRVQRKAQIRNSTLQSKLLLGFPDICLLNTHGVVHLSFHLPQEKRSSDQRRLGRPGAAPRQRLRLGPGLRKTSVTRDQRTLHRHPSPQAAAGQGRCSYRCPAFKKLTLINTQALLGTEDQAELLRGTRDSPDGQEHSPLAVPTERPSRGVQVGARVLRCGARRRTEVPGVGSR